MTARFQSPPPPPPQVSSGIAMLLSLFVPGAGHIAAHRYGTGIARIVLFLLWLPGGLVIAGGAEGGGSTLVGAPLLLGALVLWAGSLADAATLHSGSKQLLEGRMLLWLVVGVTAMMLVGAFGAAGTVTA